jgi:citrate synthase I
MDKNKINKISKYILIGFGLLVVGSFMRDIFIYGPRLREKGRYTIGIVYDYSQYKGGASIYYEYKVGNKLYYNNTAVGGIKKNKLLEKRFLVRYVYDDIDLSEILLVYPVPDSIKEAPPEGWKKKPEWAVETAISNSDW